MADFWLPNFGLKRSLFNLLNSVFSNSGVLGQKASCYDDVCMIASRRGWLYCPPRVSGYAKSEAKICVQHFHVILVTDFQ